LLIFAVIVSLAGEGLVCMFERFTDGTRRVIVMAQEEPRGLGHGYIGGEHLLLGLLRENGAGTTASALGVTLAQARREVRALAPTSRSKRSGHIPITEQAKKILELSGREAPFGHAVGPVDVLIAVLGEPDGHAAEVLAALGVDREAARRRTIALAAAEPASRPGGREPIDLRKATDMIVVTAGRNPDVAEEHMQLLGDGLVHVDYGEADQVFLVQVTRIPRVRLLDVPRPLGVFDDGMEVWLAGVTVDNYVTVTLEGRGAAAPAALQGYRDQRARWEADAQARSDTEPPAWPAERLLAVTLTLRDDVGSDYQINTGQTGGTGREWLHEWSYRPTPPPAATTLHLTAQVDQTLTTLDLALPTNPP